MDVDSHAHRTEQRRSSTLDKPRRAPHLSRSASMGPRGYDQPDGDYGLQAAEVINRPDRGCSPTTHGLGVPD